MGKGPSFNLLLLYLSPFLPLALSVPVPSRVAELTPSCDSESFSLLSGKDTFSGDTNNPATKVPPNSGEW